MILGLHKGGWMSGLIAGAEDKNNAMLELLREHDLRTTAFSAVELMEMDPGQRKELAAKAKQYDVRVSLGIKADWFAEDSSAQRAQTDLGIRALESLADDFSTPVLQTGLSRDLHHYSRDVPIDRQIDILSETMAPLAKACHDAGRHLVIHKVTRTGGDLAKLCSRVPGLGIVLDTANAFLIGEDPVNAARESAPYTWSVHFKDHYVWPTFGPLGFKMRGASLGEGDTRIAEIIDILRQSAPDFENLLAEMEIDPVNDDNGERRDRLEVFKESLAFLRARNTPA